MSQPRQYRIYIRSNLGGSWREYTTPHPESAIYNAIEAGLIPKPDGTTMPDEFPGVFFEGWHKDMYSICIRELR